MKKISAVLIFVLVLSFCAIVPLQIVSAQIDPSTLEATLQPGESITETKTVTVTEEDWDWLYSIGYPYDDMFLNLKAESGFETWLTDISPTDYHLLYYETGDYVFNIEITVPPGTAPGDYSFMISSWADDEALLYDQTVTIHVTPIQVIPEYPFGTILGVVACLVALAVFTSKRIPLLKMQPEFKT